ncbi:MAG: hypothetical protein J1E34_00350 [Oscillospiraceae bacterium]|nr:hypothetical protein [Oscillospiraceae bacterium]
MKILTTICLIFSFLFGSMRYGFVPTIVFDASGSSEAISSRASGYLYGLAEENVPDKLMAESLDISVASQKVIGGLQHPIGDVDHVAGSLSETDYIVVYLQDAFSTWYYENDAIYEVRRNGTYDWRQFVQDEYFPKVRDAVNGLKDKDYADKIVYCLYNECDNGVWFGTWQEEGQYAAFDEDGRNNFFEAWAETYELVRSIDENAVIGGPGYYEYNAQKEYDFLAYCKENNCIPDVMIYHELAFTSADDWDIHVDEYRKIEASLGVSELPIIVTEYGTMEDCGNPSKMFKYIYKIEETGTYGCIAYWRLANNLNDNSADGISPNSCWWLYRWYADMSGSRMNKKVNDLFHADFEKAVKQGRNLRNKYFNGIGSVNEAGDKISILVGNSSYTGQVRIKNISESAIGSKAHITVESVTYQGLGGTVYSPVKISEYDAKVTGGCLNVKLKDMDAETVYHITVTPATGGGCYNNANIPVRYEFENGKLLGAAYTYDSAYATTGETAGMVGGIEQPGDGVQLSFNAPETGVYSLDIIYGKHNDGSAPDGRVSATALMAIDGVQSELELKNTIKSEYTSKITLTAELKKGSHTISFTHKDGTYVLDSMLVSLYEQPSEISVLWDEDSSGMLAVAPENGWYTVDTAAASFTVDTAVAHSNTVYLRRGLNLIKIDGASEVCKITYADKTDNFVTVLPGDMTLSDCIVSPNGALTGITNEGGSAGFTVMAQTAGDYRVTLEYSNNAEGGYHAYNVDLIEQYVTVSVNGQTDNVWCRNTYSSENRNTVTFNVTLAEGENAFTLYNDGSVSFAGQSTAAPDIYSITVNPVWAD